MVDKLEKKNYLKRLRNPNDKRAFLLILTESGYELIKKLEPLDKEMLTKISKGLSENETKILKDILSKIVLNLIV